MSDNPQVSVIIPVYNRAHTILRAINSVLTQTFQDLEVIVIDDGSTDNTVVTVNSLQDKRVRLMIHEQNKGRGPARNTGLKQARGEFIAFLDSDDEWLPDKLTIQLHALKQQLPKAKASVSALYFYHVDTGVMKEKFHQQPEHRVKQLLCGCDLCPGATLLIHRSTLDSVGFFDETLPRFQDWDWLLRYAMQGEILIVNELLSKVYYKTAHLGHLAEVSAQRFIKKHRQTMQSFGTSFYHQAKADIWLIVCSVYWGEKRYLGMLRTFAKSTLAAPSYILKRGFRFIMKRLSRSLRGI